MSESEKPQIYLFLSVDIIDSTKLKYDKKNKSNWFNNFRNFYRTFPEDLKIKLRSEYKRRSLIYDDEKFVCWKYLGDEVLLYIEITQKDEVPCVIYAFKKTLEERISDNKEQEKKLKLKGTAWIGQTPFVDRKFPYELDSSTNTKSCCFDFLGPSIDCGFRIGKYSSQTEMAISVEVADLCNYFSELQESIFYKKSENLKGVLEDETEYPIFIIKLNEQEMTKEFKHLMKNCNEDDLDKYIEWHYKKLAKLYKNKISRIQRDINNYLKENESLSRKIFEENKDIKLQNQVVEVSEQKQPEEITYNDISSLIEKSF